MKNYSRFFIITVFCFNFFVDAIDIYSIKETRRYITKKRVVVAYDIDNTLLRPQSMIGSDEWFGYLVQRNIEAGMDLYTAIRLALPLYFHIHYRINLVTTELSLAEDIEDIKKDCDHVICLTARSVNLVRHTLEQLNKNNLNFFIPGIEEHAPDATHPSFYSEGVLFCGMNDKGEILLYFLDRLGYTPDLIIFIDDKEKNLKAVERAAHKRGIEFIGLRYAGCDKHIVAFDTEIAKRELQEFLAQHPFTKTN